MPGRKFITVQAGGGVLVHCRQSVHRAPVAALSLMAAAYGLKPEDAHVALHGCSTLEFHGFSRALSP